MKVAVITCYYDPDYIRARTLRAGFAGIENVELIVLKNKHCGLVRFPEMMLRLLKLRFVTRPDVYVLTFRGIELLPLLSLLCWPKPLIYDEFVNPIEGASEPKRHPLFKYIPVKQLAPFYRFFLKRCRVILADTPEHAAYSAQLSKLPTDMFVSVPVSTDEALFVPWETHHEGKFQVFYYGKMLPLHGLEYVLEAAENLKHDETIEFLFVGGKPGDKEKIKAAIARGVHITFKDWLPFEQIPAAIHAADICIAGPFGNTTQAQHVINGKTFQFLASAAVVLVGDNAASTMFEDKVNSLVVPQANAQAIVDAITWAKQYRAELPAIGKQGRKLYEKEFSIAVITSVLQSVLARL